uniref:Adenylate/guanylate cyclase n=1 Tax=uncultured bacterium 5 TaxID=1748277 RepID=A0A0U3SYL5_9BACT|nr:adenylate/guanylate cyclase [uncultured bacterium 5]
MLLSPPAGTFTFLFTDVEGSTRLWEQDPERMRPAIASHNALARRAVEENGGTVVKLTGDGVYAAFADGVDALRATISLQRTLADPAVTHGIRLHVRCGLHAGSAERIDDDFFGNTINRAARVMSAAHGDQILLSQALVDFVAARLPADVALRDLGTVWLRDLASPEHVYQVVHPALRHTFPALRSLEAIPNNLPRQATSLVGRESVLADIRELLAKIRLLVLVGIGGLGKTRLSLQAAANAIDDFVDGAWLVELAPVASGNMVPQAVALVLGVKEEPGGSLLDALLAFVKDRRLLLVLDNCEHLGSACAELAKQLLRAGPHVKILASSREPLHVAGEVTYPVPALSLPDALSALSPASLAQHESVRLFCERAQAAQPSFALTTHNAGALVEICRRLDGLPLALELAAARVRAMPVEKIAERLSDRFRLLTGGDQTTLPRQQTLRALIDWSHDLLNVEEQTLLRRLSVFSGGFTLEAAEAVAAGGAVHETDVLDVLIRLVEKSLVMVDGGQRYRQLETVRQYAREKLAHSGEQDDLERRHLAFYVALAQAGSPRLRGPEQGDWIRRFDLERENLLAAHACCDRAPDGGQTGLQLAQSMKLYWLNRGLLGLGHRLTVEALERPGAQSRNLARCLASHVAGQLAFFMGSYAEAKRYLEASVAIGREIDDKSRITQALTLLGVACLGDEDRSMARTHLHEALALARQLDDKVQLALALNAVAELHRADGELELAESRYEESLAVRRILLDRDGVAIDLLNLTVTSIGRGLGERARGRLREAHAIVNDLGSKKLSQAVLDAASGLAAFLGLMETAARFYGASAAQMTAMGMQREPAVESFLFPFVARARESLGDAAFASAERAGGAIAPEQAMAEVADWLEDASASSA